MKSANVVNVPMPAGGAPQTALIGLLPLWESHKRVRGAKITGRVFDPEKDPPHHLVLEVHPGITGSIAVTEEWMSRHKPKLGGYYVVYEDGYTSYSPAGAFEGGYTRVDEVPA